ncbi:MAG: 2-O-(6-phospho-alpha-D-mannosyl)-D-glycerate hydrolase, partial [Candidatus Hydrogenedentes bacterium]|nr:2-O-(6-phospho-alpha-D-mannosyl)-D-glycerate hydrolase [Candidatus Hydrogenedentota bacterium]
RLFASQMSAHARYNFYFGVYRPMLYGTAMNDRMYTWPQGGLPFHRCNEAHCMEHHLLLDAERHFYKEKLEACINALLETEKNNATTRFLAFMQGHDSSVADATTLRIIEEAQQYLGENTMFHSSLPDLIAKVKKAAKNLEVLKGERRVPKPMGGRIHLYSDVLSARAGIKRLNAKAEDALQRWAEPYAALASMLGAEYPSSALDLAWKTLLKCHAHDSIAGSGIDEIEQDMLYRLRQVVNIADSVQRRGFEQIQRRIDHSDAGADDVLFTVFNASPRERSEVVTVVADLPATSGYGPELSLVEAGKRKAIPVQLVTRKPHHAVINHAGDAPDMMVCDRVTFHFPADAVPGLGYATYRLERKAAKPLRDLIGCGQDMMENEFLNVWIDGNGTLMITDKTTGRMFDGLHYFEDSGEGGPAWMHVEPGQDRVITTLNSPAEISLVENGPLLARYRIAYRMDVPIGIEEDGGNPWQRLDGGPNAAKRSAETRPMTIVSIVTLKRGARAVEVVTRFNNPCKNHRLRVVFPTRLKAKTCHAESAFDVVEREIVRGPGSPWADAINPTFPMQRFVDVSDGRAGLAVLNSGLREYQVTEDGGRAIAVTLMRAFEVSLTTVSKRWDQHPEMELSQCLGEHECRYAIYPHAGKWDDAEVFDEAERLTLPLEPAQAGPHGGDMPKRHGFVSIEPANLVLTAFKQAENGKGLTIRLFNPTTRPVRGKIAFDRNIQEAHEVTLEEQHIKKTTVKGKTLSLTVGPKKIVTMRVVV